MEEMRHISLDEIFDKEQRKKLKKFLKEHKGEDPMELTGKFKEMFREWEKDLLKKGILPDYLAYAFAYQLSKFGYEKVIHELSKKKLDEVV